MTRKIFKTGNSLVVSLPPEILEPLDIREGSQVEIAYDREHQRIIINPVLGELAEAGVDQEFAQQVDDFIDKYRPALEELAK